MNGNKEILCLKVEIAPGHKELLKVHEDDEPEVLAQDFCKKFKLDPKFEEGLSNLIEFHIDNLLESQKKPISPGLISKESQDDAPLTSDANKLDLYYYLFESLADPETNELSFETGQFLMLNKTMQRILEPIWEELKESGDSIGFSEFTRAMDTLVPTLNPRDRVLLLNNHLEGKIKGKMRKSELKKEIDNLKNIKEARAVRGYSEPISKVISLKNFHMFDN